MSKALSRVRKARDWWGGPGSHRPTADRPIRCPSLRAVTSSAISGACRRCWKTAFPFGGPAAATGDVPRARLSGPPHTLYRRCSVSGALTRRADGGAGGCRTRTFAALAQPRAFRRRSFPEELPAPCGNPPVYSSTRSADPASLGAGGRVRLLSHAVSCGSSSSGVLWRTTS